MTDGHASMHSPPSSKQPARPPLNKHTLAARHGRESAESPTALVHLDLQGIASHSSSFDSGSGSSSSKLLFSFRDDTPNSSSASKTQSPDTGLETPPKLVQSPRSAYIPIHHDLDTGSSIVASVQSGESPEHPQPPTSSPYVTSESGDYGGPTRASIRAWAKATPAGPPNRRSARGTHNLSPPQGTPDSPQSISDNNRSPSSPFRAVRDLPVSAESSVQSSGSSGHSGDDTLRLSLDREESSGNVADGEGSESSHIARSPPSGSPSPGDLRLAAEREISAPHPHPSELPSHPRHVAHTHSHPLATPRARHAPLANATPIARPRYQSDSSVDSQSSPEASLPALVLPPSIALAPAPTHPDQHGHGDRRHLHHHRQHRHHIVRQRYRERNRDRSQESDSSALSVVSMPALPPLPSLPPPPPPLPLPSLRTTPVPRSPEFNANSEGSIFDDIVTMLKTSREPVLRRRTSRDSDAGGSDAGWQPFAAGPPSDSSVSTPGGSRRENDVLEDIRKMIHNSRGRSV